MRTIEMQTVPATAKELGLSHNGVRVHLRRIGGKPETTVGRTHLYPAGTLKRLRAASTTNKQ
ncbi:MAG: hypothetical protein KTR15_07780 [Phycisphaeraceae bacterium]|nr:hypothetical protein [Phycisphaeraceae bacterium]